MREDWSDDIDAAEIAYLRAMRSAGKKRKPVMWEDFNPSGKRQIVLTARQMELWNQFEK